MIIPDVNLLLYAVITGFPQHARAAQWWDGAVNGPDPVGLAPPAIFGFVRIATDRRVFTVPLSVPEATDYVRDWLAQPSVDLLVAGPEHLSIALDLLGHAGIAGNLTTDAQLAAHALEQRGQVYSNDTDFGRFPGLAWVNPLQ